MAFDGLKLVLFISGIIYDSFVLGFLPMRFGDFLKLKVPKPLSFTILIFDLFLTKLKNVSNINELSLILIFALLAMSLVKYFLLKFIEMVHTWNRDTVYIARFYQYIIIN